MSSDPNDSLSRDDELSAYQDRNAVLEARVARLEGQLATAHEVAKAHGTNEQTLSESLRKCEKRLRLQRQANRQLTVENRDLRRKNQGGNQ